MAILAILKVFLWALVPALELRAAIPIGILLYKANALLVLLVAVLADILVAFLLLLILKPILVFLEGKSKRIDHVLNWVSLKASQKTKKHLDQYGFLGLALFVGIPFPGTGVWTASLASYILEFSFKKSFFSISLGALLAGLITLLATLLGFNIEKYFGLTALLVVIFFIIFALSLNKYLKRK